MTIDRYDIDFKVREDILDSITPNFIVQRRVDAPAGEWKPADWLPIQFTKSNRDAGTDAYVCSGGKAVAFDTEGKVVPAGLRSALGGNSTSGYAATVLTYTSDDVDWKVRDLVTGEILTAATSYTGEQVADALIERGLVRETDVSATIPVTNDADVNAVIDAFISRPVGFAAYDVHVWSGKPETGDQRFTNYSKQHLIMFLTEAQMIMPHRVAGNTSSDAFDASALNTTGTTTHADGDFIAAGEYWDAANFSQLTRYSHTDSTTPAVALGLANKPVAEETDRTPLECDRSGVLVRKRGDVADLGKEGDYYLDADSGVLFLHEDTWATLVALGSVNTTFTYDYYTDTGTASSERYPHFDGPCRPGDFVVVDDKSNYTVASAAQLSAGDQVVGRVHEVVQEPRALMSKVKTAWQLSGMSAASRMPGSATKGFSDMITLSPETVADQLVVVNVRV